MTASRGFYCYISLPWQIMLPLDQVEDRLNCIGSPPILHTPTLALLYSLPQQQRKNNQLKTFLCLLFHRPCARAHYTICQMPTSRALMHQ